MKTAYLAVADGHFFILSYMAFFKLASDRLAPLKSALLKSAPIKLESVKLAPIKLAFDVSTFSMKNLYLLQREFVKQRSITRSTIAKSLRWVKKLLL